MECFKVYSNNIEGRINPYFYRPEYILLKSKLSRINHKRLSETIEFSNETWNQKSIYNVVFPYIEISDIDTTTGEIQNIPLYKINEAPSRAKMIVRENDIVISTTRPNRGAISIIAKDKDKYIASTGFAILRKPKGEINKIYLLHILRSQISLNQMLQRSSGGNYPAITSEELKKVLIPIPSLTIQNKITEFIEASYHEYKMNINKARKQLDSINDYILSELKINMPVLKDKKTYFVDSREVHNKRIDAYYYQPKYYIIDKAIKKSKYKSKELKETIKTLINGLDCREYTDNGVVYLRVSNIRPNRFNLSCVEHVPNINISKDIKLEEGDILLTRKGTYGVSTVADKKSEKYLISSEIFRIVLNEKINPHYVSAWFNSLPQQIIFDRIKTGGIMGHLSQEALLQINIPMPPLSVQIKIAQEVKKRLCKAEQMQNEAKEELDKAKKRFEKMVLER